jgi:uncharacterized protein (UPF0303 family)
MYDELLQQLITQEEELQLPYFNQQLAWELGCLIKSGAEKINAAVSIEIYAFEQIIFSYAMPSTVKDHQDWLRRKRQSVLRFGHCSYYLGQYNASKNRDFEAQSHIDSKEYCGHGGSFPIRVKNTGLIGTVTASGN